MWTFPEAKVTGRSGGRTRPDQSRKPPGACYRCRVPKVDEAVSSCQPRSRLGASGSRYLGAQQLLESDTVSDVELPLFDIEAGREQGSTAAAELPVRSEQVRQIREAFDQAGIILQSERKAVIESTIFREVASIRELRAAEAGRLLARIRQRSAPKKPATGSAWDNREEDTWIDKL